MFIMTDCWWVGSSCIHLLLLSTKYRRSKKKRRNVQEQIIQYNKKRYCLLLSTRKQDVYILKPAKTWRKWNTRGKILRRPVSWSTELATKHTKQRHPRRWRTWVLDKRATNECLLIQNDKHRNWYLLEPKRKSSQPRNYAGYTMSIKFIATWGLPHCSLCIEVSIDVLVKLVYFAILGCIHHRYNYTS